MEQPILGPVIVVIAVLGMVWPRDSTVFSVLNAVGGCWLVAAPFALGYDDAPSARRNDLVVGAAVALLAVSSAYVGRRRAPR